jgi:ABC-2 type transport system permease protein
MRWVALAWACVRRDALIDISYKVSFVFDLIDAMLMVVAYALLAGLFGAQPLDGFSALGFLLVGVAGNAALMTALVCFSQAVRGVQVAGAIKTILTTPTPPVVVMLLSSIYPFVRASVDLCIWLIAAALLGAPLVGLDVSSVAATVIVFLLASAAMAGLGFASAAFAVVFKRGDPVVWLVNAVTMLLSGVLFPTSALPDMAERVSRLLPTTHALDALRATLLAGADLADVAPDALALLGFALIAVPMGLLALAWSVRHARKEGTLGHV